MRGVTLGVFSAQPIYDVDFQTNVLDVAQSNGIPIPTLEVRLRLNKMMNEMKNIGFYQLQDTLANFALGIPGFEQFRMIDWKLTGNIYTPYGGLIYTPEGIEGNGTDAYVDTNFNPATMGVNYTLNDASRGMVVTGLSAFPNANRWMDGNSIYVNNSTLFGGAPARINSGNTGNQSISMSGDGAKFLSRLNDLEILIINRLSQSTVITQSTGVADLEQYISRSGSNYSLLTTYFYSMGASIPYPMSQSFRTIYNQFLSDSGLSPTA